MSILLIKMRCIIKLLDNRKLIFYLYPMKNLHFIFLLLGLNGFAQSSCCNKTSSQEFVAFVSDQEFVSSHDNPIPFSITNQRGNQISFPCPDGAFGFGYVITPEKPNGKFIFVFHEWWGFNDYIRQEAERLADSLPGFTILAIDLYDGKTAKTKEEASKYMSEVVDTRAQNIIKGAINYAGKKAVIGSIGWCFGGGWSLQSAIIAGKQMQATVMYYGMPEKEKSKLKKIQTPVLGIFAEKDKWVNKEVVALFESNMKAEKKSLEVKWYDAEHAFANPSNPNHNKTFSEDALRLSIAHFRKNMK